MRKDFIELVTPKSIQSYLSLPNKLLIASSIALYL